jgi:hypothetical protein
MDGQQNVSYKRTCSLWRESRQKWRCKRVQRHCAAESAAYTAQRPSTRLRFTNRFVVVSPVVDFNENHRPLNAEFCEMGHSFSGDIKKETDDVEKRLITCIQKVPCPNLGIMSAILICVS